MVLILFNFDYCKYKVFFYASLGIQKQRLYLKHTGYNRSKSFPFVRELKTEGLNFPWEV